MVGLHLESLAQKEGKPGGPRGNLDTISTLGSVLAKLPGNNACAAKEYLTIIRPEEYRSDGAMGSSNAGIATMMDIQFKASKCFRVAIGKLYGEVAKVDAATPQRSRFLTSNQAPRFSSGISDLNSPVAKPGWLLEAAEKVAGGDPQLALMILAYCGHDDISQNDGTQIEPPFQCPEPGSSMFFNGSLLSPGKREQPIAGSIALEETRGISDNTPSKNYHVITGAFIGCRLAEACGMDPILASNYERKAALAYRMLRLQSEADRKLETYSAEVQKYESELAKKPPVERPFEVLSTAIFLNLKSKVKTKSLDSNDQVLKSRAEQLAKRILTLKLFKMNLVRNTSQFLGKIEFHQEGKTTDFVSADVPMVKEKCKRLSPDQCDAILAELRSWNADLVWSANQHSMGAKLGAENCKDSKQRRNGGRAAVCAAYDKEPDLAPPVRTAPSNLPKVLTPVNGAQ